MKTRNVVRGKENTKQNSNLGLISKQTRNVNKSEIMKVKNNTLKITM